MYQTVNKSGMQFFLSGPAQQGFIRSTKDGPITTWARFTKSLLRVFDPPVSRDTINNLAPPNGSVNDYIDKFTAYMLHIGITSELQITLFSTGLQDPLQAMIAQHHPRKMETAITLACVREHLASTTDNVTRISPAFDNNPNYTAHLEVDAPPSKMARDSAPPPTATPRPYTTPTKELLPLVGYSTGAAMHPNNITIAVGPNLGAQQARDTSTGRTPRTSAPLPPTATPTLDVPPPPKLPPRIDNNPGIVPILSDTIDPTIIT
jgi:hypothetical protein